MSRIACKLSEWLPLLYILKIEIGPDAVLMETETTSWDLTLICCHVLDRMCLLINIADRDFLGLLQWSFSSRGYHFWLAVRVLVYVSFPFVRSDYVISARVGFRVASGVVASL